MRRSAKCVFAVSILVVGIAYTQTRPKPLKFEVVSVKASDPASRGARFNIDAGGTLTVFNQPLRNVIAYAYDLRDFQLTGGPGWVGTDHYDIVAKKSSDEESGPRDAGSREKIRSLLADRFGLAVHSETRDQTVYLLTIGKRGAQMTPVETPGKQRGIYGGERGHIQGFAATTEMLAHELAGITGRFVTDRTGLTGMYDWKLEWSPNSDGTDVAEAGPTIFTALQEQLGLKLESGEAPVDMIVVDHIDRPSPN